MPAFELVTVPLAADVIGRVGDIATPIRVPRELLSGAVFRTDSEATLVSRPDGTSLLRFGVARLSSALCLEPATGAILSTWDADSGVVRAVQPSWTESFVNTDIERFVDIARAISSRFPYYTAATFDESIGVVGRELREMISRIDPPAALPDRFWSTFLDDVEMGDFTTESLLPTSRDIAEH